MKIFNSLGFTVGVLSATRQGLRKERGERDDRQTRQTRQASEAYLCPCGHDVVDDFRVGVVGDGAGAACRVEDPEHRRPRRGGLGQRHPLGVGYQNRFLCSSRGKGKFRVSEENERHTSTR